MANHRIILVATPEPSARQELLARFSGQGHQVIAVERGSDALLVVAEGSVGLVILDISIQDPSGAKTVEILRKMRPRLPVIVLSGDHSVEAGRQILQHGVFYYFLKPFNPEELDQIVRLALTSSKRLAAGMDEGALKDGLGEKKGAVA
jgi:DNA-binding NtrC family response regulator